MKHIFTFIVIMLASATMAQEGFERFSVRSHGTGRTYVVTSQGLDAIGLNPALMHSDNERPIQFRLFPLGAFGLDAGSSFRDAKVLGDVFRIQTDSAITDEKRRDIINVMKGGKLSGRGDAQVIAAMYRTPSIGTFAFNWSSHAGLRTDIPDDFLDFFYRAESRLAQESGESRNFDLQALWYNEYSVSYANTIMHADDTLSFLRYMNLGGAVKYVSGIGYFALDENNYFRYRAVGGGTSVAVNFLARSSYSPDFDPQNVPNRFNFGFLTSSEAGSGYGFDVGISMGCIRSVTDKPAMLIGVSVTDLGSINWHHKAQIRNATNLVDTFFFDTNIKDLNDSLKRMSGVLKDTNSFSSSLPATLRFGAALDLAANNIYWGDFAPMMAFEFSTGLNQTVGALRTPRIGAGINLAKYDDTFSYRFGGGFVIEKDASDITIGAGIVLYNTVSIDIGTGHLLDLFSTDARLDIAVSLRAMLTL